MTNDQYFHDQIKQTLTDRFLRYVRIHTGSDPESDTFPSCAGEMKFAVILAEELEAIGLTDVDLDENGYVMATIPSNTDQGIPVVGFIAHMDTSPDFHGDEVKPGIHHDYDGSRIILDDQGKVVLDPVEFPELLRYLNQTLITTDGSTLLGADDKAGIAEIVTAAEWMVQQEDFKHGKIRLCFTPDEEIGRGTDRLDIQKFGADFAYTLDGGELGELDYENFNAAKATVEITGKSVHPGDAKDKMVNALWIARRFTDLLPAGERPENTEGREGFYHWVSVKGNVAKAELELLIRDHDMSEFNRKKHFLLDMADKVNGEYSYQPVSVKLHDQYYNMLEKIEPDIYVVELAKKAMYQVGIEPKILPVRGGTDGARLSWKGLPCPNIFTGGHNFHGPYEYIPVESMVKAMEVIIHICRNVADLPSNSVNSVK